jgi:predicted GNAT family acetyltransferase
MTWKMTEAVDEFLVTAGEFLRAERARNTILLTVTETLRIRNAAGRDAADRNAAGRDAADQNAADRNAAGRDAADQNAADRDSGTSAPGVAPLFGWWWQGGGVAGAFLHTPPFPVLLTVVPSEAAAALADALAAVGREIRGINAAAEAAGVFADAWRERTGAGAARVQRRMRLFRLGELTWPSPRPEGEARLATVADRDLLISWFAVFAQDTGEPVPQDARRVVDERLSHQGLTLWEANGAVVSMVGVTRAVDGMARIAPVYTPAELRGRGYAGATTATVSQAALDAGVAEVVLYTDLANPTSNALYQRIGYRAVEDRVMLTFG